MLADPSATGQTAGAGAANPTAPAVWVHVSPARRAWRRLAPLCSLQ